MSKQNTLQTLNRVLSNGKLWMSRSGIMHRAVSPLDAPKYTLSTARMLLAAYERYFSFLNAIREKVEASGLDDEDVYEELNRSIEDYESLFYCHYVQDNFLLNTPDLESLRRAESRIDKIIKKKGIVDLPQESAKVLVNKILEKLNDISTEVVLYQQKHGHYNLVDDDLDMIKRIMIKLQNELKNKEENGFNYDLYELQEMDAKLVKFKEFTNSYFYKGIGKASELNRIVKDIYEQGRKIQGLSYDQSSRHHTHLVNFALLMGYPRVSEGICYGLAALTGIDSVRGELRALEESLAGMSKLFPEIDAIKSLNPLVLRNNISSDKRIRINDIRELLDDFTNKRIRASSQVTSKAARALLVGAEMERLKPVLNRAQGLMDNLLICFDPKHYDFVLDNHLKYAGQVANLDATLAFYNQFISKDEDKLTKAITSVRPFSREELLESFLKIERSASGIQGLTPFFMVIGSNAASHAISISYIPGQPCEWVLADANQLPIRHELILGSATQEVVDFIWKALPSIIKRPLDEDEKTLPILEVQLVTAQRQKSNIVNIFSDWIEQENKIYRRSPAHQYFFHEDVSVRISKYVMLISLIALLNHAEGLRLALEGFSEKEFNTIFRIKNNCAQVLISAIHGCTDDQLGCVSLLLEKGVNPNIWCGKNFHPLHHAVYHGRIELAKLLIKHGADVNVQDEYGCTLLDLAYVRKNKEAMILLSSHGAKLSKYAILEEAIDAANIELIENTLKQGLLLSSQIKTSRESAIFQFKREMYLEYGISTNSRFTCFDYALYLNDQSFIKKLLLKDVSFFASSYTLPLVMRSFENNNSEWLLNALDENFEKTLKFLLKLKDTPLKEKALSYVDTLPGKHFEQLRSTFSPKMQALV